MRSRISRRFPWLLSLVFLISLILVVGLGSHRAKAHSSQLSLSKGQQFNVCNSLEAALNSGPIMSREKFWCDISNLLKEPIFTKPEWEEIDVVDNLDLAREVFLRSWLGFRFSDSEAVEEFWALRKDLFESEISNGIMRIEVSDFDWNFDGNKDRVYRYTRRVCSEEGESLIFSPTGSYHILERDDPFLAEGTLWHSARSSNAFFFEGRTYFLSLFITGAIVREPTTLANSSRLAMAPVCELRWEEN